MGGAAAGGSRIELAVAGSRTAVFCYGTREDPPILAIHGFRGTHFGLEPLATQLAAAGYRVLVPDLPGAGVSTPLPRRHDAEGYGSWLRDLADAVERPALLLGHSFGSVVAASAIAAGAAHRGAVLVNPILRPPLSGPRRLATAAARAYYAVAHRLPEPLARRLLGSELIAAVGGELMTTSSDRALRRWIRREHRRQAGAFASRDVVLQSYRASIASTVADFAAAFSHPTLVVAAGRDPIGAATAHGARDAGIPLASYRSFPDHGHLLPYEACAETAALIADWDRTATPAVADERRAPASR